VISGQFWNGMFTTEEAVIRQTELFQLQGGGRNVLDH